VALFFLFAFFLNLICEVTNRPASFRKKGGRGGTFGFPYLDEEKNKQTKAITRCDSSSKMCVMWEIGRPRAFLKSPICKPYTLQMCLLFLYNLRNSLRYEESFQITPFGDYFSQKTRSDWFHFYFLQNFLLNIVHFMHKVSWFLKCFLLWGVV
jgi:hypothetical protein